MVRIRIARRPKRRGIGLRKRNNMRRRMPMRRSNAFSKDRARVNEVYSSETLEANTGYAQTFRLAEFPRALAVSKNYRYYRATKVELEFIPYANVFAPGTAFPELYYQTDLTATIANQAPDLAAMEGRGVLPVKFTSPIKRSYSPAVLRQENIIVAGVNWNQPPTNLDLVSLRSAQPVTSTPVKHKWYMTESAYQPNLLGPPFQGQTSLIGPSGSAPNLLYHGSCFFLNTPVAPAATDIGRVVIKVHWEFKEPLVDQTKQTPIDISGSPYTGPAVGKLLKTQKTEDSGTNM